MALMVLNFILSLFFFFTALTAQAAELSFTPANSSITAAVKYTLIGKYTAGFEGFKGTITLDDAGTTIRGVTLNIDAASVRSNFPALDKVVRSPGLLDTKKYPSITFQSTSIEPAAVGYTVKGWLYMHGIVKEVEFPFEADLSGETVRARGVWSIARKDFGVTWNKFLDKGGVIVGNTITVKWQIFMNHK